MATGAWSAYTVTNGWEVYDNFAPFSHLSRVRPSKHPLRPTEKYRASWKERACHATGEEAACGSKNPVLQQFLFFSLTFGCKVVGRFSAGQPDTLSRETGCPSPI